MAGRCTGDDGFHSGERAVEIPLGRLVAGLAQQSRSVGRVCRQRRLQRSVGKIGLALRSEGGGQSGLQVSQRCRWAHGSRRKLITEFLVLALRQHGPGQRRHHQVLGMLEFKRLAQFSFTSHGIPAAEQGQPQQVPPLGQIGILLQRVLELDDGRLRVVLGQVIPRRSQHRVWLVAATGSQHADQQDGDNNVCERQRAGHRVIHTGSNEKIQSADTIISNPVGASNRKGSVDSRPATLPPSPCCR